MTFGGGMHRFNARGEENPDQSVTTLSWRWTPKYVSQAPLSDQGRYVQGALVHWRDAM